MTNRQVTGRAVGKHIGHAVEGHLRGLLRRLLGPAGHTVGRSLPFSFPVKPDVVVLTPEGKVRCLGIVAYARDASATHKKYYRTCLEHQEVLRCWQAHPARFAEDFVPLIVLYGAAGGWKEELIPKLQKHCPLTLYLPDLLGVVEAQGIVDRSFAAYRVCWEKSTNAAREHVENLYAGFPTLHRDDQRFLGRLQDALAKQAWRKAAKKRLRLLVPYTPDVRLPSAPFRARLRQGLSLVSLFPDEEVRAWLGTRPRRIGVGNTGIETFAARALFLDLVSLFRRRSLVASSLEVLPRRPYRVLHRREEDYAPHRPDFEGWEQLGADRVLRLLKAHRRQPLDNLGVFHGGALDQVAGNWRGLCDRYLASVPALLAALEHNDVPALIDLFLGEAPLPAEAWQPTAGKAHLLPLWGACVSAVALLEDSRGPLTRYKPRRESPPDEEEAASLAQALLFGEPAQVIDLIRELDTFCRALLTGPLGAMPTVPRPRLLSLDEPCSWASCCYLAAVTNSTHNPLCPPVKTWLTTRFPGLAWRGWPRKRSEGLRRFFPAHRGRVQWQFVGLTADNVLNVLAEVKSITANNWGNKSKELYGRIAETREACAQHDCHPTIVGVVDGDFDRDVLHELSAGRGYDEVYSIVEVLNAGLV